MNQFQTEDEKKERHNNQIELDHQRKITLSSCVAIAIYTIRFLLMLKTVASLPQFNGFLSQITLDAIKQPQQKLPT